MDSTRDTECFSAYQRPSVRTLSGAFLLALCVVACSTATSAPHAPAPTAVPPPPPTLIRGARIFDGVSVISATDVVLEGGRIVQVGQNLAAPAQADIIVAQGMTLLPGLIDAHSHAWEPSQLRQAAIFGVTTELDMMGSLRHLQALRRSLSDGRLLDGCDLRMAGTPITVPGGHGTEYGFEIPTITDPRQAEAFVLSRIAEGSDYLKIMLESGRAWRLPGPTISLPLLRAGIAAAHSAGKMAVVHAGTVEEAQQAVAAGADGLMHIWVGEASSDMIAEIRRKGVFVTPTLTVMMAGHGQGQGHELADDPRLLPYLSPDAVGKLYATSSYASACEDSDLERSVAALQAQGVPLLVGTDAGNDGIDHGVSVHGELRLLTKAGLTPLQALRGATSLTAERFGLTDRGRIAKGLMGDILLVRGDPTTDIEATRDIVGVWRAGWRIDRERYRRALASKSIRTLPPQRPRSIGSFENSDTNLPMGKGWTVSTDQYRAGQSKGAPEVIAGGAKGSARALSVTGTVVTSALPFPWSGVLYSPGPAIMHPVNLSGWKELVFWAKGKSARYTVALFLQSKGEAPQLQFFVTQPQWKEYHFDFRRFGGTSGTDIKGIYFGSSSVGPYRFEIDEVELR